MSLRQVITYSNLFGRVTAARRVLIFGMATAGAALGGFMGETFGLRATLVWGGLWFSAGFLVVLCSPVLQVRDLPTSNAGQ